MARRRSGLQPLHIAGAVAFLAIAGGAYWFFAREKKDRLPGTPFSASEYEKNYIGMRGGTYVVTGTIERQLRFGPDGSRLYNLEVKMEGSGPPLPVPVLVPPGINMNIQQGQEFEMSVLVDRVGVLQAREIRKT
jgi:hypothetical protein